MFRLVATLLSASCLFSCAMPDLPQEFQYWQPLGPTLDQQTVNDLFSNFAHSTASEVGTGQETQSAVSIAGGVGRSCDGVVGGVRLGQDWPKAKEFAVVSVEGIQLGLHNRRPVLLLEVSPTERGKDDFLLLLPGVQITIGSSYTVCSQVRLNRLPELGDTLLAPYEYMWPSEGMWAAPGHMVFVKEEALGYPLGGDQHVSGVDWTTLVKAPPGLVD